ncbi:hypothetical protein [Kaistella montana]|uniref:Uncharacterized protein n=1 Tax=Kaistella montana TaxID=1849733 RepID=A0ABW5K811_9FLAO|nr:hypothetical protein [Kaistella montana]MCQ4034596.1 hypothetical protein [Kaistella montana]
MIPQRSDTFPQPSEMLPQPSEMVPRPTEMVPQRTEMIKKHFGTISVSDYSKNSLFFINFDNEIIF